MPIMGAKDSRLEDGEGFFHVSRFCPAIHKFEQVVWLDSSRGFLTLGTKEEV